MDKVTLAKLYSDAYKNYSMNGTNRDKWEKYAEQILTDSDFGSVELENNDVSHKSVWVDRVEAEKIFFPIMYKDMNNTAKLKEVRKKYAEESLLAIVDKAEKMFDEHCSDDQDAASALSMLYCLMVYYYTPKMENAQAKVSALIDRAGERGIDLMGDPYIMAAPALSDELRNKMEADELAERKAKVIKEISSPIELSKIYGKPSGKGGCVKFEKNTDDYIIEKFKSFIEDGNVLGAEYKEAIKSDELEYEVTLVYSPVVCTEWSATEGNYEIVYVGDDGITHNYYSCTYGGGDEKVYTYSNDKIMSDFVAGKSAYADTVNFDKNGLYVSPVYSTNAPSSLRKSDYDVKAWFCKQKRISMYQIKQCLCTSYPNTRSFVYGPVYYPVYHVWLKSGEYVIQGLVDGVNTDVAKVTEAAKILSDNDLVYSVSLSGKKESLVTKSEAAKKAKNKKATKGEGSQGKGKIILKCAAALIAVIMSVLSILAQSALASFAIFIGIGAVVSCVLSIVKRSKLWAVILVVALVASIAFFLLVSGMLSGGGADVVM